MPDLAGRQTLSLSGKSSPSCKPESGSSLAQLHSVQFSLSQRALSPLSFGSLLEDCVWDCLAA